MSRLKSFFFSLTKRLAILGLICGLLVLLQEFFHPFDGLIDYINQDIPKVENTISAKLVAGISLGTLILVLLLFIVPFFMKGIDRKQYRVSVFRGLLSSAIFLASDMLYQAVEQFGRFYLVITIALVIILTLLLIELTVSFGKKEEEKALRTELVASIIAGLTFGLIYKLASYGFEYLSGIF